MEESSLTNNENAKLILIILTVECSNEDLKGK